MRTDTYDLASRIVERLLRNMSPDHCTWGEQYRDAYQALWSFHADMIEDVKSEIEAVEAQDNA